MRKIVLLLFFALGFFSLLSQTLIIREFIVSFGGNELGIGLFYFFWLFWVGMGSLLVLSFLGKFLEKHFLKLLLLYPLLAFIELFLFISLRGLAKVSWWEFFSLERVLFYLFSLTSFISLFTGIIFTLDALWLKRITGSNTAEVISSSYIAEALGSFFSGSLVTLFIIKLFPPLLILTVGALSFSLATLLASIWFKEKAASILNAILFIFFLFLALSPQKIIGVALGLRMKNLLPSAKSIREVYTPYQHLVLGELPSQTVVLSNGEITTSLPEVVDADKESALFLSEVNLPEDILIFGYGVENLLRSLLKFPVKNITYCLEDKIYYETVKERLPYELEKALRDDRLRVVFESARVFLKENTKRFDLAVIYTTDPSNLVLNAFFTEDFYALLKNNLKENGVVATRIRSAENYMGVEIKNYGSSLYYTLRSVFPKIVITPGELNWFFAGGENSSLTEEPLILEERLQKIIPEDFSFRPQGFRSILLKERLEFTKNMYVQNSLFKNTKLINQDAKPLSLFLNLLVLARYSNSYLVKLFKGAFLTGIYIFIVPILLFFIARIYFLLRMENIKNKRLIFNAKAFQFFSGFLGFSFHLTLIFIFQNRFGTIFQLIGLVNALFMLGLCVGGYLARVLLKRLSALKLIFAIVILEGVLILSAYPIFTHLDASGHILFSLFILFFLTAGILTGSSYALCAKLLQENVVSLRDTAVSLELLDHLGGALAGLFTGLFMLPLLGTFKTLLILFIICFILLSLFALELVQLKSLTQERKPLFLSFPYIRTSYVLVIIALAFIINSHLLTKRNLLEVSSLDARLVEGCQWQSSPFPAYVCLAEAGKEYLLETRNFAPHIKGFAGSLNLLIKIDTQGGIKEIRILEHTETPAYVKGIDRFLAQFKGRTLDKALSLKEVDGLSGATITSQAVVDIVNETAKRISASQKLAIPSTVKRDFILDSSAFYLLLFTLLAIFLYFSRPNTFIRTIYLILVVIGLGCIYNITFSFVHLANLLNLNLGSLRFLSQFLIYILPLGLALFLGQFWCGWLCPFGALQELLGSLKLSLKPSSPIERRARYFKYIFLTFFISVAVSGGINIFKQEPLSIFFLKPLSLASDKYLSLLILFFSIFFLRFWCRYFCVCGAFFSLFNKVYILRKYLLKKYRNCPLYIKSFYDIDCIKCDICMKEDTALQN